jgi:hypothetical protein
MDEAGGIGPPHCGQEMSYPVAPPGFCAPRAAGFAAELGTYSNRPSRLDAGRPPMSAEGVVTMTVAEVAESVEAVGAAVDARAAAPGVTVRTQAAATPREIRDLKSMLYLHALVCAIRRGLGVAVLKRPQIRHRI